MYSWDEDTSTWYGRGEYSYSSRGSAKRKAAAARSEAHGPRTYERRSGPNEIISIPAYLSPMIAHSSPACTDLTVA